MDKLNDQYPSANDVICKTESEYRYWIDRFNRTGKPEQALILEAQRHSS